MPQGPGLFFEAFSPDLVFILRNAILYTKQDHSYNQGLGPTTLVADAGCAEALSE